MGCMPRESSHVRFGMPSPASLRLRALLSARLPHALAPAAHPGGSHRAPCAVNEDAPPAEGALAGGWLRVVVTHQVKAHLGGEGGAEVVQHKDAQHRRQRPQQPRARLRFIHPPSPLDCTQQGERTGSTARFHALGTHSRCVAHGEFLLGARLRCSLALATTDAHSRAEAHFALQIGRLAYSLGTVTCQPGQPAPKARWEPSLCVNA